MNRRDKLKKAFANLETDLMEADRQERELQTRFDALRERHLALAHEYRALKAQDVLSDNDLRTLYKAATSNDTKPLHDSAYAVAAGRVQRILKLREEASQQKRETK